MDFRAFSLFLHIVSIFILAGGAIGGIIMELTLWPTALTNVKIAGILGKAYGRFPFFATLGAILLLLSGICLLAASGWAFLSASWLQVKLVLFLFLFLHPIFTVKPAGAKLGALLMQQSQASEGGIAPSEEVLAQLKAFKSKFTRFHIIQLSVLAVLLILATFKPVLF